MDIYHTLKRNYKLLRWRVRRRRAAQVWGVEALQCAPAVLGNAMPKSGSHLIIQVLQGLVNLGPFVNPGFPPVNRSEDNRKLSNGEVLENIHRMQSGDIGYGYLQARPPFLHLPPYLAMIFVYRDPRDFIISQVFYATKMHRGHGMHRYYTETLKTMEERINAAIQGVAEDAEITDSPLSDVRTKYDKYLDWLADPEVLSLRFEDLIMNREVALGKILDFLQGRGLNLLTPRPKAIEMLKSAIVPKSSGTFRKGTPGNWKEHFTLQNKAAFKALSGDLLTRLGYEVDGDW